MISNCCHATIVYYFQVNIQGSKTIFQEIKRWTIFMFGRNSPRLVQYSSNAVVNIFLTENCEQAENLEEKNENR